MDSDPILLPLCIVGAGSPRASLFAQAIRRLSSIAGSRNGTSVDIRVTCVCDADPNARTNLKRTLCGDQKRLPAAAEDLEAIAEYEALDEVLVCEEFGDFLCSAVLVLCTEPERAVTTALEALKAGKHVFLEPWSPALTTAKRWGGFDDTFRVLWDYLQAGEDRAICFLSHSAEACAERFEQFLDSELRGFGQHSACPSDGTSVVSGMILKPRRPDPIASKALGTVGAEHTAWIRPFRLFLGGRGRYELQTQTSASTPCPSSDSLEVLAGPGSNLFSLLHRDSAKGATCSWHEDVDDTDNQSETFSVCYNLMGPSFTAALRIRLGRKDGSPGSAEGVLHSHGNVADGARYFSCDEVDSLEDELGHFAKRIISIQTGSPVSSHLGPVALDACDRAAYSQLLKVFCEASSENNA